jgi:hypothetical protein
VAIDGDSSTRTLSMVGLTTLVATDGDSLIGTLFKMLRARERTRTPYPSIVFTFGLVVESIKKFGGASTMDPISKTN